MRIIKLGGNEIDSTPFLEEFAQVAAAQEQTPVVVHGGGKEIAALQKKLAIEPRFIDGLRVTDEASLQVVEMVLGGTINKRLVRALNSAGAQAIGLTGADLNLMRCEPLRIEQGDLMFVGSITRVNVEALLLFVERRIIPVVAPIGFGADGRPYNINADHVALALATATDADALMFVTNVAGVKIAGSVVQQLTPDDIDRHIASEEISGGMVPKVRAASEALKAGVKSVVICDLNGLQNGTGTVISRR